MYLLPRIRRQEARNYLRHVVHAQGPQQPQPHQALAPRDAPQLLHALVQRRERPLRAAQKLLPEARQLRVPPRLLKQRHPQLPLQLRYGMAQARLGYAQALRRARVVPRMRQLHKISQMVQIHALRAPFLRVYSTIFDR